MSEENPVGRPPQHNHHFADHLQNCLPATSTRIGGRHRATNTDAQGTLKHAGGEGKARAAETQPRRISGLDRRAEWQTAVEG